jgi:cobalamin biosynthesis protein CobD/CbiB
MKFLSLLVLLVLEQVRPLRKDNVLLGSFRRYARYLQGQFDGGEVRHGIVAWVLAAAPIVAAVAVVYRVLLGVHPIAGLVWAVAVLYLTLGFRQFSHDFSNVYKSLHDGNLDAARERVGNLRGGSAAELSVGEIARVAIEQGLFASHRHVFGPIAWFLVLGPAGAMLYRAAAMLADEWRARGPAAGNFGRFAARTFFVLDWVPVRLTAASFGIVGDFEDAIYCWRTQAGAWDPRSEGILLAAGGGALGVRLGDALHQYGTIDYRPVMGTGDDADVDYMTSAVGLIWRSLVLWMFVVLLVTVAHALG